MLDKMLNMMPDAFDKKPKSNFGKLFTLLSRELEKINMTARRIEDWQDIDVAEGQTLDKIGSEYEQFRGRDEDPLFRFMIKSKIAQAQSNGTINEIINVICRTINSNPEDISVISGRVYDEGGEYVGEPLAIEIESVPMRFFIDTGIKASAFVDSTRASVAAGIRIIAINIESVTRVQVEHKRIVYKFQYDGYSGDNKLTGEYPDLSTIGVYEPHDVSTEHIGEGFVVQSPLIGEEPYTNRLAALARIETPVEFEVEGHLFDGSPEGLTGEVPQTSVAAVIDNSQGLAEHQAKGYRYEVTFAGEDDF